MREIWVSNISIFSIFEVLRIVLVSFAFFASCCTFLCCFFCVVWMFLHFPCFSCYSIYTCSPHHPHTYFVDSLLSVGLSSTKEDIMIRYLQYFRGLLRSPCKEVLLMANLSARDVRSSVGRNLRYLQVESGLDPWTMSPAQLRSALFNSKAQTPQEDRWRLSYLARLLQERGQLHYECKDTLYHSSLIDSLCDW